MKFSVSSYSFQRLLNSGKYTQLDLIGVAKEMGFDGIEYIDLMPTDGMSDLEYAVVLRDAAQKAGIEIVAYTIGADFLGEKGWEAEAQRLFGQVDVAEALGAKLMRHDATGGFKGEDAKYKSFDSALPILANGCRMVTEYAVQKGIATMVENHGYFCQDSVRVEKLVNEVANPNFGLLVDMGNFMCADDEPAKAVGTVAKYAKHVHAKDFHKKSGNGPDPGDGFFRTRGGDYLRGAVVGHGDVPVYQCVQTLKRSGYDGYVTIEFEGVEDNEWAIKTGLENLKKYAE
ncbi:MAG: sugar phosphate isomerase/epimerase family protein [Acutalibacteraceae bacterium]|nr:sugar phosphate isomerase/epimerase family protein [Acutalibacteraceae bacterium]